MSHRISPAREQLRHLVCRDCGRTEDVARVPGVEPCLDAVAPAGFRIEGAEVVFRGLCPNCVQK